MSSFIFSFCLFGKSVTDFCYSFQVYACKPFKKLRILCLLSFWKNIAHFSSIPYYSRTVRGGTGLISCFMLQMGC